MRNSPSEDFGPDGLDGHHPPDQGIEGPVHATHRALADLLLHFLAAVAAAGIGDGSVLRHKPSPLGLGAAAAIGTPRPTESAF
jgi:hypothetical protein